MTGGTGGGGTPADIGGNGGSGLGGSGPTDTPEITCTPTGTGNGTTTEDGPYSLAPEATGAVTHGTMSATQTYHSEIYGYEFEYRVYVPHKYTGDTPVALMVFQDGIAHYINDIHADVAMDTLIESGEIPVAIGLFINPTDKRADEYDTPDDKYGRFIVEEIVPDVILGEYNIVEDRQGWATIGYSSGGIAGFSMAWWHNDWFSKVLAPNASWPNGINRGLNYIDEVASNPKKDIRISLMSNPADIGGTAMGQWFDTNNQMAEALEEAGYEYRYVVGDATAQHYPPVHPAQDIADGLRWIWQGCVLGSE